MSVLTQLAKTSEFESTQCNRFERNSSEKDTMYTHLPIKGVVTSGKDSVIHRATSTKGLASGESMPRVKGRESDSKAEALKDKSKLNQPLKRPESNDDTQNVNSEVPGSKQKLKQKTGFKTLLDVESRKRGHRRRNFYYSINRSFMKFSKNFRQFFCCCPSGEILYDGSVNLDDKIGEKVMFKTMRERMHDEWEKADLDKNGILSAKEVKALLQSLNVGIPEKEINEWIQVYDTDGNGTLDFEEFQKMFEQLQSVPDLRDIFLRAKFMEDDDKQYQDKKLKIDVRKIHRMYLNCSNLIWFFGWASNGQAQISEEQCTNLIQFYSPNKEIDEQLDGNSLDDHRKRSRGQFFRSSSKRLLARHVSSSQGRRTRTSMSKHNSKSSDTSKGRLREKMLTEGSSYETSNLQMSYESFVLMLADGVHNGVENPNMVNQVYQDMTRPLSHYYISSSHNSYLLGNQLNSESSPVAVIRALKLGVRVIELDAWDGSGGTPIVTHGHTLCKPTSFEECIQAIKDYGFVASEYPCIITIENHCSMKQQVLQVEIMERILGDALFRWEEADNYDEEELRKTGPKDWLSPEDLKHKFVIRDRPLKRMTKAERKALATMKEKSEFGLFYADVFGSRRVKGDSSRKKAEAVESPKIFEIFSSRIWKSNLQNSKDIGSIDMDENVEKTNLGSCDVHMQSGSSKSLPLSNYEGEELEESKWSEEREDPELEAKLDQDIDDFTLPDWDADGVCEPLLKLMYIKNVEPEILQDNESGQFQFVSPPFLSSSSLVEQKMRELAKPGSASAALNTYAKFHLIRVFPAGSRITSSNYDPIPAWNTGCQIVALNYQSFGWKVWLNQGKFSDNGGCGYVLKPRVMLDAIPTGVKRCEGFCLKKSEESHEVAVPQKAKQLFGTSSLRFDAANVLPWDLSLNNFDKSNLRVSVISGHYLPKSLNTKGIINPYVVITLRGLDPNYQEYKTSWVENNGFNPRWNETVDFVVHVKELALLSFVVRSTDGKGLGGTGGKADAFIAQNVFPTHLIRPGFRVVPLLYSNGARIDNAYLFCRFTWE